MVKRVLLIEDHALFRKGLALMLNWELGLEGIEAGSLAEGHRVLGAAKGIADLAIIELDLSDGDGSELIERLHQTEPDVPIVAITADRSLARHARALEVGADAVLAKRAPVEQIIGAAVQLVGEDGARMEGNDDEASLQPHPGRVGPGYRHTTPPGWSLRGRLQR